MKKVIKLLKKILNVLSTPTVIKLDSKVVLSEIQRSQAALVSLKRDGFALASQPKAKYIITDNHLLVVDNIVEIHLLEGENKGQLFQCNGLMSQQITKNEYEQIKSQLDALGLIYRVPGQSQSDKCEKNSDES